MKKQMMFVFAVFFVGLFALSVVSGGYFAKDSSSIFASSDITFVNSNNVQSYEYNFTVLGNTYTAIIVTNSEIANVAMSETGIGVQFQVTAPTGASGFCNVTVPASLIGSNIAVFENGILLQKNIAYTEERVGENYLFHVTFSTGTNSYVIKEATADTSSQPSNSTQPDQSGIPIGTIAVIAAVGAIAAVGIAGAIYGIKHAALAKAISAAGGAAGGGGGNQPSPSGGSGGSTGVPTGTNVTVSPHPNVQMQFAQVNTPGIATANPLSTYPRPPNGIPFLGTVFDIKTTAVFSGFVLVGLLFDGTKLKDEDKKKIRVYRNDPQKGDVWEDVTSSIDIKKNIAYGKTDHFSIFGVR